MDTKHTPGPWHVCDSDIAVNPFIVVDDANNSIADCACFSTRREANARLIAAAPELFEALILARRYVADLPIVGDADLAVIDAAIKKATQP